MNDLKLTEIKCIVEEWKNEEEFIKSLRTIAYSDSCSL